ncbi:MAG: hypothetical protein GWN87_03625, partial [Desulfuromonadales bacterium]|nr:hypothetical protein [Desulfuromonadales bacterium]
ERLSDFADILQQRARLIGEKARFAGDDAAVPTAESVSTLYAISRGGKVSEQQVNLLGEDYWNLSEVLSC